MKFNQTKNNRAILLLGILIIAGNAHAQNWTPAETSTELWLDAADLGTITATPDGVSQWNDKSGNSRNATQDTALAQPDSGGSKNDLNTITLNGTSEFFNLGTGLDWMAGGDGNATHTTFVVLNVSSYSNLYGAANGSAADASLHIGFLNANNYRLNRWANDYNPAITTNFMADEFNIMRWAWVEAGGKSVYANTLEEATGTAGGQIGSSLSAMAGGGRIGNVVGQGFIGAEICEIVMVAGAPDQDTTDRIEGYLAWKWGEVDNLPADHPYKNEAPMSGSGNSGDPAITEVVYSASTDEVTLTWTSGVDSSYLIKYSPDLSDWSGTVPGGAIVATGQETTQTFSLSDINLAGAPKLFFQIELQ